MPIYVRCYETLKTRYQKNKKNMTGLRENLIYFVLVKFFKK